MSSGSTSRGRQHKQGEAAITSRSRSKSRTPSKSKAKVVELIAIDAPNSENNAKEEVHFEFGGTPGSLGIIFGLPLVIYLLYFLSNKDFLLRNPLTTTQEEWTKLYGSISNTTFITQKSAYLVLGWIGLNLFLERVLPGETALGVTLTDGKR